MKRPQEMHNVPTGLTLPWEHWLQGVQESSRHKPHCAGGSVRQGFAIRKGRSRTSSMRHFAMHKIQEELVKTIKR